MNDTVTNTDLERNSGYKKSKLGWIPKEWEIKFVGDLTTIETGNKDTQDNVKNGRYPFFVRSDTIEKINTFSFDGEAVLTSGDGVGVGKIYHYIKGKFDYHQRVYNIHSFSEKLLGKYFYYFFSEHFYRRVYRLSAKNSVDSVRMDMIAKMVIPLPPLPEQKKIADILSTWDRAIEILKQLIDKKEKLKKGLMQQLLTVAKGETVPKIRFPGFVGEWREVRFKDIVSVDTKSLNSNAPLDYQFQYISLSDVENGIISSELETHQYKDAPSRAKRVISEGDILMATVRPNLQAFAMAKEKHHNYVASTGFAVLTPKKKFNNKYLYHYLFSHHISSQIYALIVGSNYPAINSTDVKKLKVWITPTKEEMDKIESVLTSVDKEIKALTKQKGLFEEQKKGLMQQLLTGKKRVEPLNDL